MKHYFAFLPVVLLPLLQIVGQTNLPNSRPDSLVSTSSPMDSLLLTLPEVMVKGEHPIARSELGKLIYDLPRLLENKGVNNAYEALKQLPGVVEMNGGLTLGAEGVHILIDGKSTTLNREQLYALLRSLPAHRLSQAEVMYAAPAHYQVRGAVINLRLQQADKRTSPHLQGELYGRYGQQYEADFEQRASILYTVPRFSTDLIYTHTHGKLYHTTAKDALHTLVTGASRAFRTLQEMRGPWQTHSLRWGVDYETVSKHRLAVVYNGNFKQSDNRSITSGTYEAFTEKSSHSQLHNLRMDYSAPWGLKMGGEWTYFRNPDHARLYNPMNKNLLAFTTASNQHIGAAKGYASYERCLRHGWNVNTGLVYAHSIDRSRQHYTASADNTLPLPEELHSTRRETTLNIYAGLSKQLTERLSMDVSLAAELFCNPAWRRWDFYPTLNIGYRSTGDGMWQLAVSSDKTYPDYWAMQDAVSYYGSSYSEIQGNPQLLPAREYSASITHILKSRYIFRLWFNHYHNYHTQTLYQAPDRWVEIYRYINFDFQQQVGIQASVPLKWSPALQTRITGLGVWMREKASRFYTLPFDRSKVWTMIMCNTTYTPSSRLSFNLDAMIRSRAIQGTYDLPASGHLNVSMLYRWAGERATLRLYGNDLLVTNGIHPRIRFKGQWVKNRYSYFRKLGISFTYTFGNYREKKREQTDTSRFR